MSDYEHRVIPNQTCDKCVFAVLQDEGYSNYTVQNTKIHCLLELNPDFPIDNFYGHELSLVFAKKCSNFIEGKPVNLDVDRKKGEVSNYCNHPVQHLFIERWKAKHDIYDL